MCVWYDGDVIDNIPYDGDNIPIMYGGDNNPYGGDNYITPRA